MLAQQQIEEFEQNGFLLVKEMVSSDRVLDPLIAEYTDRLRMLCKRWVEDKKLPIDAALGDINYMIKACAEARIDYIQPLDISLPADSIQSHTSFHAGPAAFDLITNETLLDAVQSLIGPEITSNPIQHVSIKPPLAALSNQGIGPHIEPSNWHQDRGMMLEDADNTRIVTAWIAITDANENNGCLRVIPGSHKNPMLAHSPESGQLHIAPSEFDEGEAVAVPVPAGGAVLLHPNTIHGSLSNHSNDICWSFDLRYNVTGEPTGREFFPSFIARSAANPESVLSSAHAWRQLWEDARKQLSDDTPIRIHRWEKESEVCV